MNKSNQINQTFCYTSLFSDHLSLQLWLVYIWVVAFCSIYNRFTQLLIYLSEGVGLNCGTDLCPTITSECSQVGRQAASSSCSDQGPHKFVDLALIFGGMDTEGEIFDDVLVYLLREEPETADRGMGATGEENGDKKSVNTLNVGPFS